MSALSGMAGANGRISISNLSIASYFRGYALASNGAIVFASSAPGGFFNGTTCQDETGKMMVSAVAPIVAYHGGVPVGANGELCYEVADPVSFADGVPITATGRVAIN